MGRKPQENPDPLPHPHRRTSASGGSPERGCAQFARNCATAQAGGAGGGRPLAPAPRRLRGPISSLIAPRASIGRGRGAQPPPPRLYFRAGGAAAHLSRPVPSRPVQSRPVSAAHRPEPRGAPPPASFPPCPAPHMADAGFPGAGAAAGGDPAVDEFRDIIRSRSGRRPRPLHPVPSHPGGGRGWGLRRGGVGQLLFICVSLLMMSLISLTFVEHGRSSPADERFSLRPERCWRPHAARGGSPPGRAAGPVAKSAIGGSCEVPPSVPPRGLR